MPCCFSPRVAVVVRYSHLTFFCPTNPQQFSVCQDVASPCRYSVVSLTITRSEIRVSRASGPAIAYQESDAVLEPHGSLQIAFGSISVRLRCSLPKLLSQAPIPRLSHEGPLGLLSLSDGASRCLDPLLGPLLSIPVRLPFRANLIRFPGVSVRSSRPQPPAWASVAFLWAWPG